MSADSSNHLETNELILDEFGQYNLEIVAYNFNFSLIDLTLKQELLESGLNITQATSQSTYYNELVNLDYGRNLNINAKSKEGTHGLLINELNIDLVLTGPDPNSDYGQNFSVSRSLPTVDTTINVICSVFCGSGHSEMGFQLRIGEGYDFNNNGIDILGDWRFLVLFGVFGIVTFTIIAISVMRPRLIFTRDDYD